MNNTESPQNEQEPNGPQRKTLEKHSDATDARPEIKPAEPQARAGRFFTKIHPSRKSPEELADSFFDLSEVDFEWLPSDRSDSLPDQPAEK